LWRLAQRPGPSIASKRLDPESKKLLLHCQGFNAKNTYDRQTPCDQDTVRKAVKDVPPSNARLVQWPHPEDFSGLPAFLTPKGFSSATAAICSCRQPRLRRLGGDVV